MNEYKSEDVRGRNEIIVEVGDASHCGGQQGCLEREVICRGKNASIQNGNGCRAAQHCRYVGLISVIFLCVSDSVAEILQEKRKCFLWRPQA